MKRDGALVLAAHCSAGAFSAGATQTQASHSPSWSCLLRMSCHVWSQITRVPGRFSSPLLCALCRVTSVWAFGGVFINKFAMTALFPLDGRPSRETLLTKISMSNSSYALTGQHLFGSPSTDIWFIKKCYEYKYQVRGCMSSAAAAAAAAAIPS